MCTGLRSAFTEGFLDYMLAGWLAAFNRRLFRLYFRRVRVCRVVLEPDGNELRKCRSDVCDCRILEKACFHRLDLCLKIDRRPPGPETPEDLPAISEAAHQRGLVRMRVETLGTKIEYCHCCSCCCHALRVTRRMGPGCVLPSGSYPEGAGLCQRCGACEKACPLGIRHTQEADLESCLGCGLCLLACPANNLTMRPWGEGDPCHHLDDRETALRRHRLLARIIAILLTLWVCLAHLSYRRKRGGSVQGNSRARTTTS
ncbi:MAG: 4Fe-4S binding protein [Planctomycetota bacterium]|jgi:ferredoxin